MSGTSITVTAPKSSSVSLITSPNDLVPSFKIFSILIFVTILLKMLFQYTYSESMPQFSKIKDLTDISLIKDKVKDKNTSETVKELSVYFKSYIMYYLTLLWTFCLIITIIAMTMVKTDPRKPGCMVKMTFMNMTPIILFMGIIGWIIYQNTIYFDKINSGHIAETYITFDTAVNVLLLVQAGIIYAYINQQMLCPAEFSQYSEALGKYGHWICIFVALIAAFCMGLNEIILRFFSTDG
jgi:hypothetical protein